LGIADTPCQGIEDTLAVIDCAGRAITEQLLAWSLKGAEPEEALRAAYELLRTSSILLMEAEDEARQPARGLGPVPANRIAARRRALQDNMERIVSLLRTGRP
jgi:hypothetical protein